MVTALAEASVTRGRIFMAGAVVVGVALALSAAVAPVAHALDGTVAIDKPARATVRIDIAGDPHAAPGQVRERVCSGALLNLEWAITAASCFADVSGVDLVAGAPRWATQVTTAPLSLPVSSDTALGRLASKTQSGKVVSVDRLVPHPEQDVVLVHLDGRVLAPTMTLADSAPTAGETLTVTGYGRTADTIVPDTAHAAAYRVQAVGARTLDMEPAEAGASLCKGDAGGPTLRTTAEGSIELVAIHHTAYQGGCLGATTTRRGATETRVDTLRAWIAEQTAPVVVTPPDKLIYTVNGGQVWEAVSTSGWKNLNSLVSAPGSIAALTVGDVKLIYSVSGGRVWEAASNNGWKNQDSQITTSGPVAAIAVNGVKYVYTVNGGRVYEAASNNGWKNLDSQIPASGAIAALAVDGVKFVYTVNNGRVYEAASNNGWKSIDTGITTSGPVAAIAVDGVKYVYTVNGGRVWEAASDNGWKNQDSQVPAPGAIAAMTARGVKYIYTVNGGQVWEAASNDGWTNRNSLVTTAGPLAVAVLD